MVISIETSIKTDIYVLAGLLEHTAVQIVNLTIAFFLTNNTVWLDDVRMCGRKGFS